LDGGPPRVFRNPILTKGGEERFISWSNNEVVWEGKIVGTVSFGIDITEYKLAEDQLQDYQRRLKGLAAQLTIAEESERRRIAADLHDQIGHSLALARMQLNGILEAKSDVERKLLIKDISHILFEALQDTKSLIFQLSSPSMNELGLAAAISEWLEEYMGRRYGLETEFTDESSDIPLGDDLRAVLFRSVRELLTNVIKHARANKVSVLLGDSNGSFKITIMDDGVGFDPQKTSRRVQQEGGFGLFSIEERMADLGGTLEIASEPGKGCKVTVTAPLHLDTLDLKSETR
jgi:signal transduction histidine kinase